ncbi:ferritin-like domain-containing protein [[Clostridium] fimetarium]|uniref:Rubrerythrin n=1 Tax=[Clostridium] fimetarium TaxID=99656 RepID=A0A1I0PKZ6_9FIRM|nr:ferritin family protein [[Clostridium] fimetarium]SEW15114.1 Rubrerythrin [[Clostridium] fimetarium]
MNNWKFAIDMELDGEKYYREQANINKDNGLNVVCLMLAEDEKKHAQILTDKMNEKSFQLIESDTLLKAKNIFEGIGNIKTEGKEISSQLDFYRIATEKEKQSIDLYKEYLAKATANEEKELFEYLIEQEKHHYEVLDNIASLLLKPEEWVENAEFGIRKEY